MSFSKAIIIDYGIFLRGIVDGPLEGVAEGDVNGFVEGILDGFFVGIAAQTHIERYISKNNTKKSRPC